MSSQVTPIYGAGALAYLDTMFAGLVPVKVLAVDEPADGHMVAGSLTVKVTAARRGYRRGEIIADQKAHQVVPRSHRYVRSGIYRINTNYRWATCASPGDNHSGDLVVVHHGREEPTVLCGYHAQPALLPDVLKEVSCP